MDAESRLAAEAAETMSMHEKYYWRVEITEGENNPNAFAESQLGEKFSGRMWFHMFWDSPVVSPVEFDFSFRSKSLSPVLPISVKRQNGKGNVVVHMVISPEGEITNVKVQRGSGLLFLDKLALDIVRTKFKKSEKKYPSKMELDVKFHFNIEDCNAIFTC